MSACAVARDRYTGVPGWALSNFDARSAPPRTRAVVVWGSEFG